MSKEAFRHFMKQVISQELHVKGRTDFALRYEVSAVQLSQTTPQQVERIHQMLMQKIEIDIKFRQKIQSEWIQCQKKIYSWILMCYLQQNSKNIQILTDHDYQQLSTITTGKSLPLMKYQTLSICKSNKRPRWSIAQDTIMRQIICVEKIHRPMGEWAVISKQLFIRGNHLSYKSPKNCRQRWLSHLNPKIKKQWTLQQDLKMMKTAQRDGKHWAFIASKIKDTKSEHMVKNRFHSLLRKQQKISKGLTQQQLVEQIIQKLQQKMINDKEKSSQRKMAQEKESQQQKLSHQQQLKLQQQPQFKLGKQPQLKLIASHQSQYKRSRQKDNICIIEPSYPSFVLRSKRTSSKEEILLERNSLFRINEDSGIMTPTVNAINLSTPSPQPGLFTPSPIQTQKCSFMNSLRFVDPKQYRQTQNYKETQL